MEPPSSRSPRPDRVTALEMFSGAHNFSIAEQNIINVQANRYDTYASEILKPLANASHIRNRKIHPPDSNCLPGTRHALIHKIIAFAGGTITHDVHQVLWLYGSAGSGKSAVAQAVAETMAKSKRLAASWFFFRGAGDRSVMSHFPITLASQMRKTIPGVGMHVDTALAAEPGLETADTSLSVRLEHLVYLPLQTAREGSGDTYLIVVDGFDECEDTEGAAEFLDHLLEFLDEHPATPIRFLITSRVEEHIQSRLQSTTVVLPLDINAWKSRKDMHSFLKAFFAHASRHSRVIASAQPWPLESDLQALVNHVQDSYVLASTLCKYIADSSLKDGLTPMKRLPLALQMSTGLDGLYMQVLQRSQHNPHFSSVISTISLLHSQQPVTAIAQLIGIGHDDVLGVLLPLQAIVCLPGADDEPITMFHTSLRDFLTTQARSGDYFVSPQYHQHLALGCLKVLSGSSAHAAFNYACTSNGYHWAQLVDLLHITDLKPLLLRIFPIVDPHWDLKEDDREDRNFESRSVFERVAVLFQVLVRTGQGSYLPHFCDLVYGIASHLDKGFVSALNHLSLKHGQDLTQALLPLLQDARPDLLDVSVTWEFLQSIMCQSFGLFMVQSAHTYQGLASKGVFVSWPKWLYAIVHDPRSTWEDLQRQGYISTLLGTKHHTTAAQTHITWSMGALGTLRDDVRGVFELLGEKFPEAFCLSPYGEYKPRDKKRPFSIQCGHLDVGLPNPTSHTCTMSVLDFFLLYRDIAHFFDAEGSAQPSGEWNLRYQCPLKATRFCARISGIGQTRRVGYRQYVSLFHECWYEELAISR